MMLMDGWSASGSGPPRGKIMATPGTNGAYWIRLHLAEFDDPRWLIVESFPEVADAVQIIYVKLLILAGKCNAGGMLVLPGGHPYSEGELAAVLRRQPATVRAALQMLENYGFVERVGDPPALALPAWHDQDVDALALLADKRQRDAERKRTKRSKIKQLQASADVSADIPRNVRSQSNNKNQLLEKAAAETRQPAAISPKAQVQNPATPSPEVISAIDRLPSSVRLDCLAVAIMSKHLPKEVLISNIQLLTDRLNSDKPNPIPNPGGWLRNALKHDWASTQRQKEAEATTEKNRVQAQKQAEAEQEQKERREELRRQAQLLLRLEEMAPRIRAEIEAEAERRMRRIGGSNDLVYQACLADVIAERNGGTTA